MKVYTCDNCGKTNNTPFSGKFYIHTDRGRFEVTIEYIHFKVSGLFGRKGKADLCEECLPKLMGTATREPYKQEER